MDPAYLARAVGYPATGVEVMAQRAGRVVARVDTMDEPVILKADVRPGAFGVEVDAIARLADAGVPVPRVLTFVTGPPEVLVLSWTEGQALSSHSSPRAQRDAGRILRQVHGLGTRPPFSGQPTVDAWIDAWCHQLNAWWQTNGGGTCEQAAQLRRWHDMLRPALKERSGHLMLFDGRPEHFLVDDDHVVGIIDVHDLGPGDAAIDFAVIHLADPLLTAGVLEGYQPTAAEKTVLAALIPFFTTIEALAAADWHLQYGDPDKAPSLLARAAHELAEAPTCQE